MTSYRYGYVRVSTLEQDPAGQLDAMATAGVDRSSVFVEHASGATDTTRAGQGAGGVEAGRHVGGLAAGPAVPLEVAPDPDSEPAGGARRRVHSVTEAMDTITTSTGRLLCDTLASLAAFERDVIREHTMAGLAAARSHGKLGGRPPIMTADKIAVARRLLAEGHSKTAVAKTIGVSRPTLYLDLDGRGGPIADAGESLAIGES